MVIGSIEQLLTKALHRVDAEGCPIPHQSWQRALSGLAQRVIPAPHQSHWMEWEYGIWVGAFAGFDEAGRQLGEANVLPEWRAIPLGDRWRPFKGPGIRQGRPYNVDAMQEMAQCWDDLLLDAVALRSWYCREYQRSGHLSALDLYIMTSVAVALSAFLLRRGDAPVADGALPRRVAAAFKVLGGMYAATNRMMSQAHPLLLQEKLDADVFLQYLEDEQLLLSPEMRACGGPVKMIRQMLATLIEPSDAARLEQAGFDYLGDDQGRAFAYGMCCVRIDVGVLLHWRSLRHYLQAVLADAATPVAVCELLKQEAELGLDDNIPLEAYLQIAEALLSRVGISAGEQAFLAALPRRTEVSSRRQAAGGLATLEKAIEGFARYQQQGLDQALQRPPAPWPEQYSPAPGSVFLKQLLRQDKALAATFKAGG